MRRVRTIVLLALALGATAAAGGLLWPARRVSVRVEPVRRGDLTIAVSATATATVESETEVQIRAEVPGRIARLLVQEGDRVQANQPVALLDQQEAQAQVALARANLEAARARLRQAEAGVTMLAEQVRTRIAETRANLEKASRDLERLRALFAEGAIPRQQLDASEAAFAVARAAHEAALADRDQERVKAQEVSSARAAVAQMEAALRLVEVQLSRTIITSPLAGLVTKRLAAEGEAVGLGGGSAVVLGGSLFVIVDPTRLYVRATIDELDAARLHIGQEAHVTFDALPGRTFRGHVYHIAPAASGDRQEARTFAIRIAVPEAAGLLRPGMSADVEVVIGRRTEVLLVPAQAVLGGGGQQALFVVEAARARRRPVRVGAASWTAVEVLAGVGEGELVVVTPDAPGLADGARVRVRTEGAGRP